MLSSDTKLHLWRPNVAELRTSLGLAPPGVYKLIREPFPVKNNNSQERVGGGLAKSVNSWPVRNSLTVPWGAWYLNPSLHQPCKCTPHSESQSPSQVSSGCRYDEKNTSFSIFKINCCCCFFFTLLISSLPCGEEESIHSPPQGAAEEAAYPKRYSYWLEDSGKMVEQEALASVSLLDSYTDGICLM